MKYFKKLLGEKVYLSPLCSEDAEIFTKWFNDFKVTDGTGRSSCLYSKEMEQDWINNNSKSQDYNFSIVNIENNEIIGNCSIVNINYRDRTATTGLCIGEKENRGKGYGTEALKLLLDYGFNYLNLNNIELGVFSFNEMAIACYKKVGFKEYGRRRQSYFLNGKYYDEIHMDILSEEFKEDYIKNKNISNIY